MPYPLTSNSVISPAAVEAAIACLRSGSHTMGKEVAAFESEFSAWTGAKHAVMVNSGSSANLLAVEAMIWSGRWKRGDEVLVPALAWSTTVFPLVQLGLVPVFVDIDPETLAMDLKDAERMFSPKTRGLMLIHVLGLAADLVAVKQFCLTHDLALIEDCCEAMGAHWQGHHVGTYGVFGTFSHFYSHQLATIEGGTVVTDDDGLADDLRSMRAHGWTRNRKDAQAAYKGRDTRFLFVTTGYNVRPMELQGATGRQQLAGLDHNLRARDASAAALIEAVACVPWLEVIGSQFLSPCGIDRNERRHSWMNVPLRLRPGAPMTAGEVIARLTHVETRPILSGNLLNHPVMKRIPFRADGEYPVASVLTGRGFMIGCHAEGLDVAVNAIRTLRRAA